MKVAALSFLALLAGSVESKVIVRKAAKVHDEASQNRRRVRHHVHETPADESSTEPEAAADESSEPEAAAVEPAGTCGNGIVESGEECDSGSELYNDGLLGNGAEFDPCQTDCQWKYDPSFCPANYRQVQLFMETDWLAPTSNAFFLTDEEGDGVAGMDLWVNPVGSLEGDLIYHWTACVDAMYCHFVDFFDMQDYSMSSRPGFTYVLISDGVKLESEADTFFKRRMMGRTC